jgi:hypothetical protein
MPSRNHTFAVILSLAAALAVIAAVLSPVGNPRGASGSPEASPAASPQASPVSLEGEGVAAVAATVTIELTDGGFVPHIIQATSGHDLTITLVNTGTRDHGFTIEEFDIDELLTPGETKTVVLRNPLAHEVDVDYVSNAPGDDGMRGTLVLYI